MICGSCLLVDAAVVLVFLCGGILLLYRRKFQFWSKRNITQTNPKFPLGDFNELKRTKSLSDIIENVYNTFNTEKVVGMYAILQPSLLVRDPDIIKDILIKDFSSFHDRGIEINTDIEPLANHLFMMSGQEWRNLRVRLTPTFTSGKMKMMFSTIADVGKTMLKVLEKPANNKEIVEVKDYMARYTTDVIASCAFGIEINSLENPDNEFREISKDIFTVGSTRMLLNMLAFTFPKLGSLFKIRQIPPHVTKFFLGAVKNTMEVREEKNIKRNDFMQLLIQLKNQGYIEDADADKRTGEQPISASKKFTVEQAAAQAFIFFFAGFETSSSTMLFALYELSINPELQTKLQEEIDTVMAKHGGVLTYDGMQEMDFLDRVISETLRKYPVANALFRVCNKDYAVPNSNIVLHKGDNIMISLTGLQNDPKHFPNPEKFDPDRFLPEEREGRHPFVYLPFGDGPRACIGNRFALMQSKVGLAILLSKYTFEVSEKTVIPVKMDPKADLMTPLGGMHLRIRKRM